MRVQFYNSEKKKKMITVNFNLILIATHLKNKSSYVLDFQFSSKLLGSFMTGSAFSPFEIDQTSTEKTWEHGG